MKTVSKHKIIKYMKEAVKDHVDGRTGEVNCTTLAEDAAIHFGVEDWLNNDTHDIWVWSVEVSEQYERNQGL